MKRPLFVFAGQSNMVGASTYGASEQVYFEKSFEYLHKKKRLGAKTGEFKNYGFPTGEFAYKDLVAAYGENPDPDKKSTLNHYANNSYFCPSMNDIANMETKQRFSFYHFSEANVRLSASVAPFIVKGLEENGYACAYAHMASGGVPIRHFTDGAAAEYFYEKVADFFADSEERFAGDDMSERILVWNQGESDRETGEDNYVAYLEKFWARAKSAGFTKFFIIRVSYWGDDKIADVMRAQEKFCEKTENAYIITRAASFLEYYGRESAGWFDREPEDDFKNGRDSFYGIDNEHLNEKGHKTVAKYAVPNIIRVVFEGKEPVLEEERVIVLK